MILDLVGCWVIEQGCKFLFADLEPKEMVTRGRERREARRVKEEEERILNVGINGEAKEKVQ